MTITARFMTIADLLALQSCDAIAEIEYRTEGFGNRYGIVVTGTTVADILPVKQADIASDPEYYGELRESMRSGQTVPLGVFGDLMTNGAHRVALAIELGLPGLLVDEDFEGSTDRDFDNCHLRTRFMAA
jgi:hypothetical protein